jgi:hypothetical protein
VKALLSGIISGGGNFVMTRSRKTEEALDALIRLRESSDLPAIHGEVSHYLAHKSNAVVAKAAKLAADLELHDVHAELITAFHRFMKDAATTDRGCAAKTEIVRTLEILGIPEADVFLAGLRHVQMEGSFGPPVDTAAALRAACAMGLIHMNHPGAVLEIVPLLVDREIDARIGAVRALSYSGTPEAEALLRFKALQPEASAEVMTECFAALLAIAPVRSLAFVGGHLDAPDPARLEAAAIALGQSRQVAAVKALKDKWRPAANPATRSALLLGLALARDETAIEFLFSLVETAIENIAVQALTALAVYRHDARIRGRAELVVGQRNSKVLQRTLASEFQS